MAQSVEVTEEVNNGTTNNTPITKSINTRYLKSSQDQGSGALLVVAGRDTMDTRVVSEDNATVLAAANGVTTTDIEKLLAVTVLKGPSGREVAAPFAKSIAKIDIVEFYADLQTPTDSVIVLQADKNDAERKVYIVDETYTAIKAKWLL